MSFGEIWLELERGQAAGEGQLIRRIYPDARIDLFLAVAKPSNRRMLVLEVDDDAVTELPELPSGRGIGTDIRPIPGTGRTQLGLALIDGSSSDIFEALARDVAESVAPTPTGEAAVTSWLARLVRWQRLLEHLTPEGLSPERQRGIYGELWLLRHHLLPVVDRDECVRAWTGPDAASHDFEFERCAIEVKATAGKQHQVLRIASERQLDDTGVAALYLFHISLDVRHGEGETLPEAVASVRRMLEGTAAAAHFEDRLLTSGYSSMHEPRYDRTAYTARETNFFSVGEDFPRLTEADLPPGVGDLRYSVAVSECKHHQVDDRLVIDTLLEVSP